MTEQSCAFKNTLLRSYRCCVCYLYQASGYTLAGSTVTVRATSEVNIFCCELRAIVYAIQ